MSWTSRRQGLTRARRRRSTVPSTAYCSQGLEFIWGGGTRTWPADYPEDGHKVVVTGLFETYTEGTSGYVHLVDASPGEA